jgi:hypothetical protein
MSPSSNFCLYQCKPDADSKLERKDRLKELYFHFHPLLVFLPFCHLFWRIQTFHNFTSKTLVDLNVMDSPNDKFIETFSVC